jgi:hypothetical protein
MKLNILTERSWIFLGKPVIAYRVLKFSALYGNRRCTRAHDRTLFLTRRSQSVPSHSVSVSHISQPPIDDYVIKFFFLRRLLWKIFCKHVLVLLCVPNAPLTLLSGLKHRNIWRREHCTTAHTVFLQQPVTPSLLVATETQFHKYTKELIKLLSYYCNFYVFRYKVVWVNTVKWIIDNIPHI